jgi:DNA-directed RNA polymerase specialized sigma24 family protein
MTPDPEHAARDTRDGGEAAQADLLDRTWSSFLSVFNDLSPRERMVLALHNSFGHTRAEVADLLGIEESEVDAIVENLRLRLAQRRPDLGSG